MTQRFMKPKPKPAPLKGQPQAKSLGYGCVLFLVAIVLGLVGWGGYSLYRSQQQPVALDYEVSLPGGYKLLRDGYKARVILDPQGRLVLGPDVSGLALAGPYVIAGEISDPDEDLGHARPVKGRFMLDVRSGLAATGLSVSGLSAALKSHGAPEPPDLLPPSRFLESQPNGSVTRH